MSLQNEIALLAAIIAVIALIIAYLTRPKVHILGTATWNKKSHLITAPNALTGPYAASALIELHINWLVRQPESEKHADFVHFRNVRRLILRDGFSVTEEGKKTIRCLKQGRGGGRPLSDVVDLILEPRPDCAPWELRAYRDSSGAGNFLVVEFAVKFTMPDIVLDVSDPFGTIETYLHDPSKLSSNLRRQIKELFRARKEREFRSDTAILPIVNGEA